MPGLFTHRIVAITIAAATILLGIFFVTGGQYFSPPVINVGSGQYYAALMKWNSLHASEYEETFQDQARCRFKIIVTIDRSSGIPIETVTRSEGLGTAAHKDNSYCKVGLTADSPADFYPADFYTVGALFELVGYAVEHPTEAAIDPYHGFRQYYSVQFDPTMGYP